MKSIKHGDVVLHEKPAYIGYDDELISKIREDHRFHYLYPYEVGGEKCTCTLIKTDPWFATMIMKQNTFGRFSLNTGRRKRVIYLHMSILNHSCDPNAILENNNLIALRDIRIGEEINISYKRVGEIQCRETRNKLLQHWFRQCSCQKCLKQQQQKKNSPNWLYILLLLILLGTLGTYGSFNISLFTSL